MAGTAAFSRRTRPAPPPVLAAFPERTTPLNLPRGDGRIGMAIRITAGAPSLRQPVLADSRPSGTGTFLPAR